MQCKGLGKKFIWTGHSLNRLKEVKGEQKNRLWCVSLAMKKVIEWYFFNNQSIIPSTDVIQLTLTLKMTTAQVVETSDTVNNNSPIQDFVHPDDQTQPTFDITKGDINIFWNTDVFVCLRLLFFLKNGLIRVHWKRVFKTIFMTPDILWQYYS